MAFKMNWPPLSNFPSRKSRTSQQFEASVGWLRQQHAQPRRTFQKSCTPQSQARRALRKTHLKKPAKCYRQADFSYDNVAGAVIYPAGKLLWSQFTQLGHC